MPTKIGLQERMTTKTILKPVKGLVPQTTETAIGNEEVIHNSQSSKLICRRDYMYKGLQCTELMQLRVEM